MSMWTVKNNILYTSNHGFDKMTKPLISFDEFLLDMCIIPQSKFNFLVKDLYEKEISKLPTHMKSQAVATIVKYRKDYAFFQEKHRTTPI
jgi:hypothetical protein